MKEIEENKIDIEPDQANAGVFLYEENDYDEVNIDIKSENGAYILSSKFPFKFKNLGYSRTFSYDILEEQALLPPDERDYDLIFSCLLMRGYYKMDAQDGDANRLTFDDMEYIARRFETEPEFLEEMTNMVKYGDRNIWGDRNVLGAYIYHTKIYDHYDSPEIKRRNTMVEIDDRPDHNSPEEMESVEFGIEHIKNAVESAVRKNEYVKEDEAQYAKKDDNIFNKDLSFLKEVYRDGNKEFAGEKGDGKPTVNMHSAASALARALEKKPWVTLHSNADSCWEYRNARISERAWKLENDFDFQVFMNEEKDNIPELTKESLLSKWNSYLSKKAEDDKKLDINEYSFAGNDKKAVTKTEFEQNIADYISRYKDNNSPFMREDMIKAVDYIIAKTLSTKAAQVTFYDKITDKAGNVDTKKADELLQNMRNEIVKDQAFKDAFIKRGSSKSLNSAYQSILAKNVNTKIKEENKIKKEFKKDKVKKKSYEDFIKEHDKTITGEQANEIKEAYKNLTEYNKGKSPSEYMKKMMDAMKSVVDELNNPDNFNVNMMKLATLNKTVLDYYDKRQGLIMGPRTDNGKSRLAAVERLSKTTSDIVKGIRKDYDEHMTKQANAKAAKKHMM